MRLSLQPPFRTRNHRRRDFLRTRSAVNLGIMTAHRPQPLRSVPLALIALAALGGCADDRSSTAGSPAAGTSPVAQADLATDIAPDLPTLFGGQDLYVRYDKDSRGLPLRLDRISRDRDEAIAPFLAEPTTIYGQDCIRLVALENGISFATVCDQTLWQAYGVAKTSSLTTGQNERSLLGGLLGAPIEQVERALSLLSPPTPADTEATLAQRLNDSNASRPTALLTTVKRGVETLIDQQLAADRFAALTALPAAERFLDTYPGAPAQERAAIAETALQRALTQTTTQSSSTELKRVLRVLPLTPEQRDQGLSTLRKLGTLDGLLSAFRLSGDRTDAAKAKARATLSPGKADDLRAAEAIRLIETTATPEGLSTQFAIGIPAGGWTAAGAAGGPTGSPTTCQ